MANKNDYSLDFLNDYEKCRVIIKDADTESTVTDTTILEYDKDFHSIKVKLPLKYKSTTGKFSLLIFTSNKVLIYLGTTRKVFNLGFTEIALYSGRIKEDRKAQRFPININGIVCGIVIDNKTITLRKPLDIQAINISATGILLNTMSDCFFKGSIVKIEVEMYGAITTLYCNVVRIKETDMSCSDYGCRLVSFDEPEGGQ